MNTRPLGMRIPVCYLATLKGRCLSFAEREEIALGRARGETIRVIARRLGRAPSYGLARAAPQR